MIANRVDLPAHGLADGDIPWWAVSVLQYKPGTDHYRIRRLLQNGHSRYIKSEAVLKLWQEVVTDARQLAGKVSRQDFVLAQPDLARKGALTSTRAFYEFCQILDDTGRVPILKDFQVRGINSMRRSLHSLELWPFSFGKSWHSSVTVPLMDWAENPEFTECRIYFNPKFVKTWTRTLMYVVEHNQALHSLFPHVARPDVDDPCFDIWSLDGFCIKGKSAPIGYSWEALTVNAGITGRRYWRTGCDDWVVSDNAKSEAVQDSMWDYFFTGPMTFQKPIPFNSFYETKASTIFVVGTLFDRRDFGYRLMQKWRGQKYPVHKVDVYTDDSETEVIWPEERPATWVQEQKENLDPAQFNARVRNRILATDQEHFTEEMVSGALDKTFNFGEVPMGSTEVWMGFDPASGKRGKYSKYPAMALLAFRGDCIHLVKWARWPYPMPRQVQEIVDHAKLYQCPVAVEDTSQQIAYRHWISQMDPSVRVINHVTNATTKRDWRQGVESLIPYFQSGNFIIHAGNATNQEVNDLKKELLEYPQSKTSDILMAIWIAKYQQYLHQSRMVSTGKPDIPSYIRSRGYHTTVLDLKALREGRRDGGGRGPLCPHCERMRCICPPGTIIRTA